MMRTINKDFRKLKLYNNGKDKDSDSERRR